MTECKKRSRTKCCSELLLTTREVQHVVKGKKRWIWWPNLLMISMKISFLRRENTELFSSLTSFQHQKHSAPFFELLPFPLDCSIDEYKWVRHALSALCFFVCVVIVLFVCVFFFFFFFFFFFCFFSFALFSFPFLFYFPTSPNRKIIQQRQRPVHWGGYSAQEAAIRHKLLCHSCPSVCRLVQTANCGAHVCVSGLKKVWICVFVWVGVNVCVCVCVCVCVNVDAGVFSLIKPSLNPHSQVFCMLLFCLDDYWYFSLFTLAMLLFIERVVVGQVRIDEFEFCLFRKKVCEDDL